MVMYSTYVCEEIYRLVHTNVQELQILQIYSYLYLRMDFTARRLVLSEMITYGKKAIFQVRMQWRINRL